MLFSRVNHTVACCALLFLGITFPAHSAVYRVLLVGDSWTEHMWDANPKPLRTVFAQAGYPDFIEKGDVTAIGGTTASVWAQPGSLQLITDEINANPTIDCIHLSIGGNDILAGQAAGGWFASISPEQSAALYDTIMANIAVIVGHCLSLRPNIDVVFAGYDYLAIPEIGLSDLSGGCGISWYNLGYPNDAQLDSAIIELERRKKDYALSHPHVWYVQNLGLMQWTYGYPNLSVAPHTVPLPGQFPDFSPFPGGLNTIGSPRIAMAGSGSDCIHLSDAGYTQLATNMTLSFYLAKFAGTLPTPSPTPSPSPTPVVTDSPTPTPTPYDGRPFGDFDSSGCTDVGDFLYLLDHWQTGTVNPAIDVSDFLNLLDNWQLGPGC